MHVHKLSLVLALAALGSTAAAQQINVNKDNRTIAITATDSASADADVAVVHIGFQVFAPDEKSAYAAGSQRSNAISKALADFGVAKSAMESENQNVSNVQPYENQNVAEAERANRRFTVSQSWTVRCKPDDAAKVLNAAVGAGANQSGQIEWQMADGDVLQSKAAAKALSHARSTAEQMAQGLNIHLGALLYASNETRSEQPIPVMRMMLKSEAAAPVAPLSINPRKVERSATVYAVFAIE